MTITTTDTARLARLADEAIAAGDRVGAYVASYAAGHTCTEIAERYGTTRSEVATSLRRALGSLSRRVARQRAADWLRAAEVAGEA
jgi:transposase